MTQEYETPIWKQWSSIYCSGCYKWLANYKGWNNPIGRELYCRKCSQKIQKEQQTNTQEGKP